MAFRRTDSGAPPGGRREHRKHLTRRELLAAGRKLFAEKGIYDSRIEDLSREAGIGKGTLYLYFENKERLIEAVATNGFNELLGHVHRAVQGAQTREHAIARVAQAHIAFFEENPDLMRVFHQVRGLLTFPRAGTRALRQVLANYLAALGQLLELSPPSAHTRESRGLQVAMLLFGAVSGVISLRVALGEPIPTSAGSQAMARALVGLTRAFEEPARAGVRRARNAREDAPRAGPRVAPRRTIHGPPRRSHPTARN